MPQMLAYVCPAPVVEAPDSQLAGLLDVDYYSRLSRLLRVMAWVMKLVRNAAPSKPTVSGPLQATEINDAELYWLQNVQHTAVSSELAAHRGGKPLP
ncbi:hypothetical protein HPB48_011466 [Haemaphysalis longicornis]|uniref:Uncharacterized protein n=1 Tax=Haemaphysalis longicornis TaxID=44386 RepID=A0A9J6GS21_HAELO|nr:hypothetical protein HPB48_011466 [Haemaphysalis longicornis]